MSPTKRGTGYPAAYCRGWVGGLLALAVVLTTLTGCASRAFSPSDETEKIEELPILWQQSGTYSRLKRPVHLVVLDRATLAQLSLTAIPVDFKTQMVLVCGLGPVPDDRRGVRIVRLWRRGTTIHVQEEAIQSDEAVSGAFQPASPWTAVIVPRSDLNVEGYHTHIRPGLFGNEPTPG